MPGIHYEIFGGSPLVSQFLSYGYMSCFRIFWSSNKRLRAPPPPPSNTNTDDPNLDIKMLTTIKHFHTKHIIFLAPYLPAPLRKQFLIQDLVVSVKLQFEKPSSSEALFSSSKSCLTSKVVNY